MEKMNERQSLQIITQMIETAKNNITHSSFYFLLWGWAVFAASIIHYILLMSNFSLHFLPWPVLMTAAGVVAGIHGYKDSKTPRTKTYFDKFLSSLWISTTFAIVTLLVLISLLADFKTAYVSVIVVFGLGTIVTGSILKFAPLIIGGIMAWLCAISYLWVDFPEALLVMALAILSSYIIPGYLLRAKREREQQLAVQ